MKKKNISRIYLHKSSSTMFSIGESSLMSTLSHVVVELRVLETIIDVCKGFNALSKHLTSLSNIEENIVYG